MGTNLYKTKYIRRVGQPTQKIKIELTQGEVKDYIKRVNKWNEETYKKQYYLLRNKIRSYEAFTGRSKQSVSEFLYKEAKAKERYKEEYTPTIENKRIREFTAISSGKALEKALQSKLYIQRRQETFAYYTNTAFNGLIEANEGARRIAESISDPVKREKALSEYANQLHVRIGINGKIAKSQAISSGETYGSDIAIDFDFSKYL